MHEAEPPPAGLAGLDAHMEGAHARGRVSRVGWLPPGGCAQCLACLSHPLHGLPCPLPAALAAEGGKGGERERGGLHTLFAMVLGGLVGATPHMISAAVMALARLLYEFAPVLAGLVPDLLPAVLLLLRTKAREVIKAVLGFIKVGGGLARGWGAAPGLGGGREGGEPPLWLRWPA